MRENFPKSMGHSWWWMHFNNSKHIELAQRTFRDARYGMRTITPLCTKFEKIYLIIPRQCYLKLPPSPRNEQKFALLASTPGPMCIQNTIWSLKCNCFEISHPPKRVLFVSLGFCELLRWPLIGHSRATGRFSNVTDTFTIILANREWVIGDSHDGQIDVCHLVTMVIWAWTSNVVNRGQNVPVGQTPTDTIGPRSRSRLSPRLVLVVLKWRNNRSIFKARRVFSFDFVQSDSFLCQPTDEHNRETFACESDHSRLATIIVDVPVSVESLPVVWMAY